jgi:hypothetical protein
VIEFLEELVYGVVVRRHFNYPCLGARIFSRAAIISLLPTE